MSLHNLFKKERETFEFYKESNPELFIPYNISEKEIFSSIGINIDFLFRLKSYFRLYFQDFIVEEVSLERDISEVEPKETKNILPSFSPFTAYADLVKVGISTPGAILSLAKKLKIRPNKIGHGGIKDIKALTSQKIAFPNIDLEILENVRKLSSNNFFLTNFSFGKGSVQPGQIFGNRFTIFIRTKEKKDEKSFLNNLKKIEKEGFLNFYQVQRFGTPRLLSHLFGKLILQGKYEEAVFSFLFKPGLRGIPFINELRRKAEQSGSWRNVENVFKEFPYTFRNELRLISYLKEHPNNFVGALFFLEDQTTMWIYSYTSYLFNLLLSLNKKLDLPEQVPLLLSGDSRDREIYKFWIEKDKVENFQKNLQIFPFIVLKRRLLKTRIFPQQLKYKVMPGGIILSFILEKGVYATTFLMNLFEMKTGKPIPEWLSDKEYDIKKELGIGSVEKVKKILGKEIFELPK